VSDEQLLLLCLAGLYALECACLLRRDETALITPGRTGCRPRRGIDAYGNERWGLSINHPVPAWGYAAVCQAWPLSLGTHAVFSYVTQAPNPGRRPLHLERFVRYDELVSVRADGRSVRVNGELFVLTGSHLAATRIRGLLEELRDASPDQRAALIDGLLARSTDIASVASAAGRLRRETRALLGLCMALCLFLFVIAPWVTWRAGLESTWAVLLAILVLLNTSVALEFHRVHRRLYPESGPERRAALAGMLLFPLATLRAHDRVWRQALAEYHPLAAAAVLCPPEVFRDMMAGVLRDLAHPLSPPAPASRPEAAATAEAFHARASRAMHRLAEVSGIDIGQVLAEPVREVDSRCFCPRCLTQYIVEKECCETCPGVRVRPFGPGRPQPEEALFRPAGSADDPSAPES
jgi:hypothetical protein